MDITTLGVGRDTRDRIAEFRDARGHDNYDEALRAMLEEVGTE